MSDDTQPEATEPARKKPGRKPGQAYPKNAPATGPTPQRGHQPARQWAW